MKLTRRDSPDGRRHFIPTSQVESVSNNTVRLRLTAAEIRESFRGDADALTADV